MIVNVQLIGFGTLLGVSVQWQHCMCVKLLCIDHRQSGFLMTISIKNLPRPFLVSLYSLY